MTSRERWTVYPLLLLAIGLAMRPGEESQLEIRTELLSSSTVRCREILIESDDVYSAMQYYKAAITTSGTASLECAIMDTPEVVCYKLSSMSYLISSLVNKAPFISMVNLIGGRIIVPEFLQHKANQRNIVNSLLPLLNETVERKNMLDGMSEVRRSLGIPGVYDRAAEAILSRT